LKVVINGETWSYWSDLEPILSLKMKIRYSTY
jgi:hypothetical protein